MGKGFKKPPPGAKRTQFKKGQSGNPNGRPPAVLKPLLKNIAYKDLSELASMIVNNDIEVIEEFVKEKKGRGLQFALANAFLRAANSGDIFSLDKFLDRLVGRVPSNLNIVQNPTPTSMVKKSYEQFCIDAGYPKPYPKQVEMKNFVLHGGERGLVPRLLLGARKYGKTDYTTVLGIAYDIYENPQESTNLITTKVEKNGIKLVREIARCLTANGVELEVENSFEIRVKGLVGKDASVTMVPVGSSGFRMLHPKRIVFDDAVVPGKVSEADREQVLMVYGEAIKLCKNIAVIGQPVDFRDLYAHLRKLIETMEVPYGTIPELDDDLDLQRASGVDEQSIKASYFLVAEADGDANFAQMEMIEKFPSQESIGFIDPSGGGDTTAIGAFTQHFQGMAIVGNAYKKAWYNCIDEIREMVVKYKIKKLGFEVNMFGTKPLTDLREELKDLDVVVEGKYTHSNKEARIQLAAQFTPSMYMSKESNAEYRKQVLEYSHDAKKDDAPDTIATFLEWAGRIKPPKAAKKPSKDL